MRKPPLGFRNTGTHLYLDFAKLFSLKNFLEFLTFLGISLFIIFSQNQNGLTVKFELGEKRFSIILKMRRADWTNLNISKRAPNSNWATFTQNEPHDFKNFYETSK